MLQKQVIEYYDWNDVEAFLCEKMEIPVDKFGNYHDIVGGKYKDFWHVWLSLVHYDVINDKMSKVWFDMLLDEDNRDEIIKEYGDWVKILFPSIEELQKEINDESINILYSW